MDGIIRRGLMDKTDLDRKHYPQYLELLKVVQESLKINLNTELDFNGDFADKRTSYFDYMRSYTT